MTMQDVVYVIDGKGIGPILGYTTERFKKLESNLKRTGYRTPTIEELKKFKNIEEVVEPEPEQKKGKGSKSSLNSDIDTSTTEAVDAASDNKPE